MAKSKVRVAVIGLRFGGSFAPIYLDHPDVEHVGICDTNERLLYGYGEKFKIKRCHKSIDEVVKSDDYDAVHILTPIHQHAKQSIDVLNSGKHCAATVPAATTIDELKALVAAEKKSGKNYMMMETAVYTHHCLYVKELIEKGELGRIQFLRGAHYQDMSGWPPYWKGLPPMHYATHAVSPLLAVSNTRAAKVHCFGSGVMAEELTKQYKNPYPVETAIFQLEKDNLAAEVTRSLFHTARDYMENFNVYGENATFEWHMENEAPLLFKTVGNSRATKWEKITLPDYSNRFPKEIAYHFTHSVLFDPDNPHLFVRQGGVHHGSHPHLVHEFLRSIIEERKPAIDAVKAADWTAAGICAHESAMRGGAEVIIPKFD
jgi:predicted dehydrogenase